MIRSLLPSLRPYFSLEGQVEAHRRASHVCRCSSVVARSRFELKPIAPATTISIPAGNKASDLWRRFIAVFIAAPSTHCPHSSRSFKFAPSAFGCTAIRECNFWTTCMLLLQELLPSTFFIHRGPTGLSFSCLGGFVGFRDLEKFGT